MDWRCDGLTALVVIAAGKAADLVVLGGNRAKNIDDVERVETVLPLGDGERLWPALMLNGQVWWCSVTMHCPNQSELVEAGLGTKGGS